MQVGHAQDEGLAGTKGDTYAGASSIGWREFAIKVRRRLFPQATPALPYGSGANSSPKAD